MAESRHFHGFVTAHDGRGLVTAFSRTQFAGDEALVAIHIPHAEWGVHDPVQAEWMREVFEHAGFSHTPGVPHARRGSIHFFLRDGSCMGVVSFAPILDKKQTKPNTKKHK